MSPSCSSVLWDDCAESVHLLGAAQFEMPVNGTVGATVRPEHGQDTIAEQPEHHSALLLRFPVCQVGTVHCCSKNMYHLRPLLRGAKLHSCVAAAWTTWNYVIPLCLNL